MESGFYVTLPSNSSMQYFPDNKTSNFLKKLPITLQLDGEWEAGLAEIDYPHTWNNIREGNNSVEFTFQINGFKKPVFSLDITNGGPIQLKVSGSGKEFLDLARLYL